MPISDTTRVFQFTGFLLLACVFPSAFAQLNPDGRSWKPPDRNNIWFAPPTGSDTVFIFVHGINSDSASCWLYTEDGQPKQYWPYLVWSDSRLGHPSVFLGGYNFGPHYNLFDAVGELLDGLTNNSALNYPNIIFIAHSMGGVVVRRMLIDFSDSFRGKSLGVLLFGSPSAGSSVADFFHFLHRPDYERLETDSPYLKELDQEFRSLMEGRHHTENDRLHISGAEVAEGDDYHGITQIVSRESATRYFDYRTLPGDHSSIVKPATISSPSHEFVVEFYKHFTGSSKTQLATAPVPPVDVSKPIFLGISPVESGTEDRFKQPIPQAQPVVSPAPAPIKTRLQGVLNCSGAPIRLNQSIVFDNLPRVPLEFSWDRAAWYLTVHIQPNGNKQLVLTSRKPGIQTYCQVKWSAQ